MKNLNLSKLSLLALAGLLAFTSCKKEEDMKPEEAIVSAEDNARIETEMESVQDFVDAEAADPDMKTGNPSKSRQFRRLQRRRNRFQRKTQASF